jgi:hypothetical protein
MTISLHLSPKDQEMTLDVREVKVFFGPEGTSPITMSPAYLCDAPNSGVKITDPIGRIDLPAGKFTCILLRYELPSTATPTSLKIGGLMRDGAVILIPEYDFSKQVRWELVTIP